MFLSLRRGRAMAWPALGHRAGAGAPLRPGGRSCLWDSGLCPQGKQPAVSKGVSLLSSLADPAAHVWSGGSSRMGRGPGAQEDTDPDLG